jgi:hypothetical protein
VKKIIAHFFCLAIFCPLHLSAEQFKSSAFYSIYKNYLSSLNSYKNYSWKIDTITDPIYIPESSSPDDGLYNKTLIWVSSKSQRNFLGFRPIKTVTGCKSGCTPVVFHLVINSQGDVVDILFENDNPLRKKWHKKLSVKDLSIIKYLAKTLPQKLSLVEHPLDLTDNNGNFPPQTWTFYKDILVPDGAYTSYAVYNISLMTKQYLHASPINKEEQLDYNKISLELQNLKSRLDDGKYVLEKLKSLCVESKSKKVKTLILKWQLSYIEYFLGNHKQSLIFSLFGKDQEFLFSALNDFEREYTGYLLAYYLDFLKGLLFIDNGTNFLSELRKKFYGWNNLPLLNQKLLIFLSTLESNGFAKIKISPQERQDFLNYANHDSALLEIIAKSFTKIGDQEWALKAYAHLHIRFPKKQLSLTKEKLAGTSWLLELKKQQQLYNKELVQDFSNLQKDIPNIKALSYHKIIENKKIYKNIVSKKQVYIFFAPWCAHCFELVKVLAQRASPDFWKKVQLVATSSQHKDFKDVKEFIELVSLKNNSQSAYLDLLVVNEGDDAKEFYDKMQMYSVPKIVITNSTGKIINFSYNFNLHPEKDFEKDLNYALNLF